jgi:hypothetical protein
VADCEDVVVRSLGIGNGVVVDVCPSASHKSLSRHVPSMRSIQVGPRSIIDCLLSEQPPKCCHIVNWTEDWDM